MRDIRRRPLRAGRSTRRLAVALAAAALAACGGNDGGTAVAPPASCSVADQQQWLGNYMNDWYFWYRLSPHPDPAAYADVESYFDALLYTGSDPAFPADRFSRSESTESFNRFYGEGSTLGYGVSVAGLEVADQPTRPLYVRHVEPFSPAAALGVRRGDEVLAMNGRSASDIIAADDFSDLTAGAVGQVLTLEFRRDSVQRTVIVSAAVFTLTPVSGTSVLTTVAGRKLGYVAVKDLIVKALTPLETSFSRFRAEGVKDVVLDLRYNGGGLVSTGGTLASYVAGTRGSGRRYATLLYNDQRSDNNQTFGFSTLSSALSLPRVFVLMGRRTCSASEQVINGLRGVGVEVVAIGETSCGKPVGSLPASACDRTYSVINFESVNDGNEGRYFDGFDATCAVAEDFTAVQGSLEDPLVSAATQFADSGSCPVPAAAGATRKQASGARATRRSAALEGSERAGMIPR
ncbi:MAG TPA: S41 family peptidase [Rubrivivax sp.]|nr:S41 family peptidase [Rubrivivax sp.]